MSMKVNGSNNESNPERYTMETLNIKQGTYQASIFSKIDNSDGRIDGFLTEEQYQKYTENVKKYSQQTKKINFDQLYKDNKFFDNPKKTKITHSNNVVIRTEEYPNGEEKIRFYYKRIDNNRATVAIIKRNNNGNIIYENECTINNPKQAAYFISDFKEIKELLKDTKNSDKFFDNPKKTKITHSNNVVIRTEEYPNGEEKTRFYYKRIDNNRATVAIIKRNNSGEITFEQEITVNDFSL